MKISVHFFTRKPNGFFFSIEELFETIQQNLSTKVFIENHVMPFASTGLIYRIKNIVFAKRVKGFINHITGDIHYIAIFLPRRSTILTIHDCGELEKHTGLRKLILWLFWFYLPVKKLKYVTTISEATKRDLLSYVKTDPDKIRVIPNCVIGNFKYSSAPFNAGKPTILQIGVTPNKNIERVAAALRGIPCLLKIIGTPSKEQIHALKTNGIEFTWQAGLTRLQIIDAYEACDFVVFVSLLEGFGLPIIEAQATGKPVITSNTSAMPETAGAGACLINPYSVDDIRSGILKIINNSAYREQLITSGLENSKRFSPQVVAEAYLKLYKQVQPGSDQ